MLTGSYFALVLLLQGVYQPLYFKTEKECVAAAATILSAKSGVKLRDVTVLLANRDDPVALTEFRSAYPSISVQDEILGAYACVSGAAH